jgi:tricorn protease
MFQRFSPVVAITCVLSLFGPAAADQQPHAGMLRFPDVSKDRIVFVYANDLWTVPREGGVATPLASPQGAERFPKFSPDGSTISFIGNYDGNQDLYVMPATGGVPTRATYHPDVEVLCDWTPDGQLLFYSNRLAGLRRQTQLFTIPTSGGLPAKLPVPYGANGAISPDGQWLAYTPHTIDFRTWKRYRGGMQTDIWLFNLKDHTSKKMTDWEGTDSLPMWNGSTVFYMSDQGPEHRLNIWSYDTKTGKREQVTKFADYDVKWPSIGPGPTGQGEIVFQKGPELFLLDCATKLAHAVPVTIPGDRPKIRPRDFDTSKFMQAWDISPTGKRAIVEARGDIWTLPAEKGTPRNLTRTSGSAERDPMWSPDGRWVAYFSDETGEYELYIRPADGKGDPRKDEKQRGEPMPPERLTTDGHGYRFAPAWSPDSKWIGFSDNTGAMYLCNVARKETRKFDTDPDANQPRMSWSSDSNWIAYAKGVDNRQSAIWLYNVATGEKHQVTSGFFNETWPTFDRKGDLLFFASNRNFTKPMYEDVGTTFVYANTDMLMAVPLRKDVKNPLAPKSDEETPTTQPADATSQPASAPSTTSAPASQPTSKPDEKKPVVIELEGFEERAILLPPKRGQFSNLSVNHEGKLVYTRGSARGEEDEPSIKIFDLVEDKDGKREEKTVFDGAGFFVMSADGKKLLIRKDDKMAIVDAAPDQKMEKTVPTDAMKAAIDPRAEWRQIFNEVWRLQRDYFYVKNMHGVDWAGVRNRYAEMLDDCASREDVSYVISEMISELNIGHTYYFGGDIEDPPKVTCGLLGADFELHEGAYRIARIHHGAPWDADARGPLSQPGVDVKEGDYLLAVNHVPVDPSREPWAAMQGLAGKTVILTVSSKPKLDNDARDVVVEALSDESPLRFRSWIERNRKYVDEKTGGKVGYIYVPNTGIEGQNELFRQFYGQTEKQALIIDERWNGGGQIPTRFIELLNRPPTNYWARRDARDWRWPPDSHPGPKCMLINGLAGSGGDAFPAYFRRAKLGKLIGMRTWGGLVGISGNPQLIDGGATTVPTFGYYKTSGTWGIEGHGVDPDIEVVDDPAQMADGGDPQLDRAISLMLDEIQDHPYVPPRRPADPDRSGMGIRDEDK